MSLIGDALRKARQEAADRESDRKGVLFSARISDSPTRSNLGLGLALGAVIAVAATVIGGGSVWWVLGQREAPQPSPTPATNPVIEANESPAQSAALAPTPAEESPRPRLDEERPPAVSQTESTSIDAHQPAVQPAHVAEPPATPGSRDQNLEGGFTGMEDGDEVYILEATLGEVHLSLDFIIFREDDPFAEINGVELHLGGVIDGYRVKTIERDRVRLSNGHRSIVLRAP